MRDQCLMGLCVLAMLLVGLATMGVKAETTQITFDRADIPGQLHVNKAQGRWQITDKALVNRDENHNDFFGINAVSTDTLSLWADVSIEQVNPKGGFWGLALILKDGTRVQVFNQSYQLRYYVRKKGDKLKPMTFANLPGKPQRSTFHVSLDGKQLTAWADDGKPHERTLDSSGIVRVEFQVYQMKVVIHSITVDGAMKQVQANDEDPLKSELDVPADAVQRPTASNALVIFYIGDSITRHGFNAATIKKLGWDHLAGMAATSEAKDFAHLFADHVQQANPRKKVSLFFHSKGGAGAAGTRYAILGAYIPLKPDIVVVQLGEHEKQLAGQKALENNYRALLSTMLKWHPKPLILCVGVWNPYGKGRRIAYTGWTLSIDQTMSKVCQELSIPYASMASHALDPACSGWGTSNGVKWHPNDIGQKAYADELIRMYDASKGK